jgi:hypothetical protein
MLYFIPGSSISLFDSIQLALFTGMCRFYGITDPVTMISFDSCVVDFVITRDQGTFPVITMAELMLIGNPQYIETVERKIQTMAFNPEDIVVGFSMGGLYATHIARVCKVPTILLDSPDIFTTEPIPESIVRNIRHPHTFNTNPRFIGRDRDVLVRDGFLSRMAMWIAQRTYTPRIFMIYLQHFGMLLRSELYSEIHGVRV